MHHMRHTTPIRMSCFPLVIAMLAASSAAQPRQIQLLDRSIVAKDQGYFPVAMLLKDGRLAVVLRGGAPHLGIKGRLDIVFSKDQAKTWTTPTVVADSPADDRNPAFGQANDGTLVVAFWRTARYDDQGRYDEKLNKPINTWVTRSHDAGTTWSDPAQIDVSDIGWGSPYGKILTLPDGDMLMNIYGGPLRTPGQAVNDNENNSYLYRSTDNARTWTRFSRIGAKQFNETALARLPSGLIIAAMRTDPAGEVWLTQSADRGNAWSEPKKLTPPAVHPADLVVLKDGRLLLVTGYRAGPFGVRGAVSDNDGRLAWDQHFILVNDLSSSDCGYPSSVVLNDGRALTVYYAVATKADPSLREHCGAVVYNPPVPALHIRDLDSTALAAKHPRVFFSPAQVELAKKQAADDPRSKATYARFIAEAEQHLAIDIKPLDETWWQPAKTKRWEDTYPEVFENTWIKPMAYAKPAATLATAWLLSGQQRFADKAVALLMNLSTYSFLAEHYDVGMNYAVWGIEAMRAYDALIPVMSQQQRSAFDACLTRMARAVAANDAYWIEHNTGGGINNHLAWHKAVIGLLGLFYDHNDMIEYCLRGPRGLLPLLQDGLVDHGLWCESSLNYQFAAIGPMIVLADAQKRLNHRPNLADVPAARNRTLKHACDAMFDVLAPDGMIPPIGDAYGHHQHLQKLPIYESAWTLWADPKYAWLINRNPQPSPALLFAPPLPHNAPSPPIRSILLPEHGYAFLRWRADEQYWDTDALCAFLSFDRSGVHANADKLSLMLFGQRRMLLSDVEGRATVPHAFSSRIQRELNRGALSQNTVMIDGQDQKYSPELLQLVEWRDAPDEKRASAADERSLLYDGVRQMRTVIMTAEYVLDVFQVRCSNEKQIDWIAHVMNEQAAPGQETRSAVAASEPFALPQTGAWQWLRHARSHRPPGPLRLDWRQADAHLRLRMLDDQFERVVLCGYPSTDQPQSPAIPMVIVRKRGQDALFAAIWIVGDDVKDAQLKQLPAGDRTLLFQVNTDSRQQQHAVPRLH